MTQKLLSLLRDGLAATTDQQPGAAAQLRPALSITTALTSNGMATRQLQSPPFHVLGPGDVISLNPERIIVRSPTPDSLLGAENEFACIDFDRADFPWLFTPFGPVGPSDEPANPDKKTRLTLWLCLIVLAEQENWAVALERIGKNAFGYRTNFFLTSTPDLTAGKTITVKIDGLQLDPVDVRGATVWTYDSTNNSVNFEPLFVPEPGKTLTITYFVACIP